MIDEDIQRSRDTAKRFAEDMEERLAVSTGNTDVVVTDDDGDDGSVEYAIDNAFDISMTCDYIDGRLVYGSCAVQVAAGGPSVRLDTSTKNVEVYWWGADATYPMSNELCEYIDDYVAREYWNAATKENEE